MNTEIFDLGKIGITLEGEWDKDKVYEKLTIVTRSNKPYISKKNNTAIYPENDINQDYWMLLVDTDLLSVDLSDYYNKEEVTSTISTKIKELIGGAPEDFDTLKEIADALLQRPVFNEDGKINGDVISLNNEDFSVDSSNNIVLKDRDNVNKLGYVIVRDNKSISSQLSKSNTIYEIRYALDLKNTTLTIPKNCILKFEGGSIENGTIVGNNTIIESSPYQIFHNITTAGTFLSECYVEWFGAKPTNTIKDYNFDNSDAIQAAFDSKFKTVKFNVGIYNIDKSVILKSAKILELKGKNNAALFSKYDLPYAKDPISSTVITTSKNIDLLVIAIECLRDSRYDNKQAFHILGGVFDVSLNDNYSSSIINIKLQNNTSLWNNSIKTSIIGPIKNRVVPNDDQKESVGINIEDAPIEDNNIPGVIYITEVDSFIQSCGCGFKNSVSNSEYITSFDFKGVFDGCYTSIDLGEGIQFSRLMSTLQSGVLYEEKGICCIIGNIKHLYLDCILWDNNQEVNVNGTTLHTFTYLCEIKNGDNISLSDNLKLLRDIFKGDTTAIATSTTIVTSHCLPYGRNRNLSYLDIVNNNFYNYDDYTIYAEEITGDNDYYGNPFDDVGLRIRPKNTDIEGTDLSIVIDTEKNNTNALSFFIIKTFNNCINNGVKLTPHYNEIEITLKYKDKQETINYNNSIPSNNMDLNTYIIDKSYYASTGLNSIVVKFKNLHLADNATIQNTIYLAGSYTYNNYTHLGTNKLVDTKKFILTDHEYYYKHLVGTAGLVDKEDTSMYFHSKNPLMFYNLESARLFISKNIDYLSTGLMFNITAGGFIRPCILSINANKTWVLCTIDGKYVETEDDLTYNNFYPIKPSTGRPENPKIGFQFYDVTLNRPIWWNGENWITADGTLADSETVI